MLHKLEEIMNEYYGVKELHPSDNFKKDYGLTSFDFINLICLLEERFSIEFDEKDYIRLNTVEELIEYIKEKATN